jgi:spore maturation protein CgeB
VLWIISHPSEVSPGEIAAADLVLAASRPHAAALAAAHATPVRPLLQFTDTRRFRPQPDAASRHGVLFVGNWRSRLRPAVWHALRSGADVALYGRGWDLIAPRRTVAQWVDNAELPRLYSSCDVLLNDHWPDMRALGYLSNRLFDALACGAPVLSDAVEGLEEELGDAVETYADGPDLRRRLAERSADDPERAARTEKARRLVEARHGADARAAELLELTLPLATDRHADFACIPAIPGGDVIDPPMLSE